MSKASAYQLKRGCHASFGHSFAFVGTQIVDLIGNGKFTGAAPYIPALFLIALIQTTEQPANAVVCALGRAASATWARIILAVAGFISLYPAVVLFGIKGVIAICIIEAVVYRLYLRILANRERKIPFQDHVAVFGDRLRSLGGAAAHAPIGFNDGRHRSALRCWPPLHQRDELGGSSDGARATRMIAVPEMRWGAGTPVPVPNLP